MLLWPGAAWGLGGGGAAAEEVKFGVRGVSNGWTDEEKQKTGEGNWGGVQQKNVQASAVM